MFSRFFSSVVSSTDLLALHSPCLGIYISILHHQTSNAGCRYILQAVIDTITFIFAYRSLQVAINHQCMHSLLSFVLHTDVQINVLRWWSHTCPPSLLGHRTLLQSHGPAHCQAGDLRLCFRRLSSSLRGWHPTGPSPGIWTVRPGNAGHVIWS